LLLSKHTIQIMPRLHPRFVMQFENLTKEENERLSRKINLSYYSCGCSEGALFLLVGLISYLVYILVTFKGQIYLTNILRGILFLFIFTTIGKIIGILIGRFRLRYLIKNMLNNI